MEKIKNDLTGMRFGKWYVKSFSHKKKYDKYYNCVCDCGTKKIVLGNNLKRGLTNSCGCELKKIIHEKCFIDLTGQKFNKLTCIRWERKNNAIYWLCKCDCGKETWVKSSNLKSGAVKSCGCAGDHVNRVHGMSHTRLHGIWSKMLSRCHYKNDDKYKWYGARGITVCEEWHGTDGFKRFMNWSLQNGYSDNLSIDRIDNDKGYFPNNCRWTNKITQANNTRSNVYVTFNDETHTIAEWSRILGIKYATLSQRITKLHWPVEDAFEVKKHERRKIERNEKGQFLSK